VSARELADLMVRDMGLLRSDIECAIPLLSVSRGAAVPRWQAIGKEPQIPGAAKGTENATARAGSVASVAVSSTFHRPAQVSLWRLDLSIVRSCLGVRCQTGCF
jgi:hypothetical protein